MIVLPYADDIRDLDGIMEAAGFQKSEDRIQELAIIDSLKAEEKNAAKLLIKNLTIDFDARNYDNPVIQKFYSGLQALALNEDEPEPVEDLLEPNYEEMQRFQPVINKFKSAFFAGYESDEAVAVKKPLSRGRGQGRGVRGVGTVTAGSSQSSNGIKLATGTIPSKKRKAEPINEAVFDDSDGVEEVKVPQKRRKIAAKENIKS